MTTTPPLEVRLSADKRVLTLAWAEERFELSAKLLRVESPSAEVKGHFGIGGKTPEGKEDVTIMGVEAVGHYAVKLVFSDGHQSGIFTWNYFRELGQRG